MCAIMCQCAVIVVLRLCNVCHFVKSCANVDLFDCVLKCLDRGASVVLKINFDINHAIGNRLLRCCRSCLPIALKYHN